MILKPLEALSRTFATVAMALRQAQKKPASWKLHRQVDWQASTMAVVDGFLYHPGVSASGWLKAIAGFASIFLRPLSVDDAGCQVLCVVKSPSEFARELWACHNSNDSGCNRSTGDWLFPVLSESDLLLELSRDSAWSESFHDKSPEVKNLVDSEEMRSYTNVAAAQDDAARTWETSMEKHRSMSHWGLSRWIYVPFHRGRPLVFLGLFCGLQTLTESQEASVKVAPGIW